VKALVLAAGYATRLSPLTDEFPKPLLPVGGRPMLDWIVDRLGEVDEVDEVHVVTNARYARHFRAWGDGRGVEIHDDGTTTNEGRLGAIGDIVFVLERIGVVDDLLAVAGDNLFDFSLRDLVGFWQGKGVASALGVYDVGDRELAKQYGVVELDDDDRVVSMVEKPEHPASTLAATAAYVYHREHLPLIDRYLADGNSPDQPGRFLVWLYKRAPVYAHRFTGEWSDIGDRDQLLAADNRLRRAAGLRERDAYVLE
jgi:glucose-1-phosphate thymidylyltransferase